MIEVNKILNEDCLETMAKMPNCFVDLTVTSPPYDNLRDYKGFSFDFENIAIDLYRITKIGGVVIWVVGDSIINGSESGTSFKQALYFKKIGFNLHDTMIYLKAPAYPDKTRYSQCFEYMFVLSKGKPKTINKIEDRMNKWKSSFSPTTERRKNGELKQTGKYIQVKDMGERWNAWYIPNGGIVDKDKLKWEHPATFPDSLPKDHIYSWSNEGDLIYDPFMGSGTTAKAAFQLNRNYIGSEISKEYCDIAEKRINIYKSQTKMSYT